MVGADCLVFGSDFPHSEGLPDPIQYASQLKGLDDVTVKKIMRDNLANFLAIGGDGEPANPVVAWLNRWPTRGPHPPQGDVLIGNVLVDAS